MKLTPVDCLRPAERRVVVALHMAFGPGTGYGIANTPDDTLDDWLDFREIEPSANLRIYALMLVDHEVRQFGTPAIPLLRRVAAALKCGT